MKKLQVAAWDFFTLSLKKQYKMKPQIKLNKKSTRFNPVK